MSSVIPDSTRTCPECGLVKTEAMPANTAGREKLLRLTGCCKAHYRSFHSSFALEP